MILMNAHEELFKLGMFSVKTWGFIVAIGIVIAMFLALKEAKKKKLTGRIEDLLVVMLVFGLIFGRIAYVLINPSEFKSLFEFLEIWNGGIVSWGALSGVIFGSLVHKKITKTKKEDFLEILDLLAPYLILAIAIGRIGCFLRGCCFGIETDLPWGVLYLGDSLLPVHPTQLYHFIADLAILFLLLHLRKKPNPKGVLFFYFVALYSLERIVIDFFRYHQPSEYLGMFTLTQLIFFLFLAAAIVLIKNKKRK